MHGTIASVDNGPKSETWAEPAASSSEVDAAVAEVIDALEEARLVRIHSPQQDVQQSMDHIKTSLAMAVRRLAPFAFHAERWLGDEIEQWPAKK